MPLCLVYSYCTLAVLAFSFVKAVTFQKFKVWGGGGYEGTVRASAVIALHTVEYTVDFSTGLAPGRGTYSFRSCFLDFLLRRGWTRRYTVEP